MKSVSLNSRIITVFLILFFAFIIRLPFLTEPLDADSGLFAVIGSSMHQGITLYKDAIDNKPPGIFLLFFLLFAIFKPVPFVVNMFVVWWQVFTVFLFYCLAKEIFNKRMVYITTLIFAAFSSSPFIYGVSAETENFMVTFIIIGFYFLLKSLKKQNNLFLMFLAGLSLGTGFLFKVTAVLELSAITVFLSLLAIRGNKPKPSFLPRYLVLTLGFLIPFSISLAYFLSRGLGKEFIFALFIYNLKYA